MTLRSRLSTGRQWLRRRYTRVPIPAPAAQPAQWEQDQIPDLSPLLQSNDRIAVFVRYEQGDDLPACQAAFLADLAQLGWRIWIIDNSPTPLTADWQKQSACTLYWQRRNQGMCVGAYAQAILLLHRSLSGRTNTQWPNLALINNSFLPLLPASANPVLMDLFSRPLAADQARGLTEAREQAYHLQSYLLLFGSKAWCAPEVLEFWKGCLSLSRREDIITHGEVALTAVLKSAGLHTEALLPLSRLALDSSTRMGVQDHHPVSPIEHNPYLVYWKELLKLTGIIKKSALNNASQSRTAQATLVEFIHCARQAGLPGAEAAIDRLVRG